MKTEVVYPRFLKIEGGQFEPKIHAQFKPKMHGQFKPKSGGQFDRFLHIIISNSLEYEENDGNSQKENYFLFF
ncbi:hypothetical protein NOM92_22235, partial [Chryseobacterium sp. EO14]|nr:hypothetical protein [Chryseobacterium sp. EO14]